MISDQLRDLGHPHAYSAGVHLAEYGELVDRLACDMQMEWHEAAQRMAYVATPDGISGLSQSHNGRPLAARVWHLLGLLDEVSVVSADACLRNIATKVPILAAKPTLMTNPMAVLHLRGMAWGSYRHIAGKLIIGVNRHWHRLIHLPENKRLEDMRSFVSALTCTLDAMQRLGVGLSSESSNIECISLAFDALRARHHAGTARRYLGYFAEAMEVSATQPIQSRTAVMARSPTHFIKSLRSSSNATVEVISESQAGLLPFEEEDDDLAIPIPIIEEDDELPRTKQRQEKPEWLAHDLVLINNPSPWQAGLFGLHALAMITLIAHDLVSHRHQQEAIAAQAAIHFSMTTGCSANSLLKVPLTAAPHNDTNESYVNLATATWHKRMNDWPGYPPALEQRMRSTRSKMLAHDPRYLPLSPFVVIPLAPTLVQQLNKLISDTRCHSLQHVLNETHLAQLIGEIRVRLDAQAPNMLPLTMNRLARSFNGHYHAAGLRPVYSYWMREKSLPCEEMPARYTHVNPQTFTQNVIAAHKVFLALLRKTTIAIAAQRGMKAPDWLTTDPSINSTQISLAGWGSYRCARPDRLKAVLQILRQDAPGLFWLMLFYALTGMRSFEPRWIKPHQVSADGRWIALRGKPNVAHPAHRGIPLASVLRPFVLFWRNSCLRYLFESEDRNPLSVATIQEAIYQVCEKQDMPRSTVPDLYSLRHLWRSIAEEVGIDHLAVNYLMGHQAEGTSIFDPYLDHPSVNLEEAVNQVANRLLNKLDLSECDLSEIPCSPILQTVETTDELDMPVAKKPVNQRIPVTSMSDDRLLCLFGPDTATSIADHLLQEISGDYEDMDVAKHFAYLALALMATKTYYSDTLIAQLIGAKVCHLRCAKQGEIQIPSLPYESACEAVITLPIAPISQFLAMSLLHSLSRGKGHGGRNRIGALNADQDIVDIRERPFMVRKAHAIANAILKNTAQKLGRRAPSFWQFAHLIATLCARDPAVGSLAAAMRSATIAFSPFLDKAKQEMNNP